MILFAGSNTATAVDQLLTRKEVAEWLQVTEHCMRRWAHIGRGPVFVKVGWFVRYRRADVEKWLNENLRNEPVKLV